MENLLIKTFLSTTLDLNYNPDFKSGYNDGCGYGHGVSEGYGYSDSSGSGFGFSNGLSNIDGDGYGDSSDGCGYGCGFSNGKGYGYYDDNNIKSFNNQKIYIIDEIPTILNNIHGNYAKGGIVNNDFTITPCYIVKIGDYFAHGKTLKEAFKDANTKALLNTSIENRIAKVIEKYPFIDTPIPHKELFYLHNALTGSCELGRKKFAESHNLDLEHGNMTMRTFINLTINAYEGKVIKQLAKAYGI